MRTTWADPDRRRELLAATLIGGLGLSTLLIHARHLAVHALPPLGVIFGVAIPMAFSVALVGSALWLLGAGFGDRAIRIAVWCLVGTAVLLAVGSSIAAFQVSLGDAVGDLGIVLVSQATVGALLGVLLGVYDAQRLVVKGALVEEREMANRLGRRLTVLNRVLRHDVRHSVNVIRGNARLIVDGTNDPERVAETIGEQATRMVRLSEQAREIETALSNDGLETDRLDLSTAVSGKTLSIQSRYGYASVHRSIEGGAWVEASPLVETAVEKLLENAIEHNDATDPSVWVDLSIQTHEGRGVVVVRVEDDGPGIPAEQIAVLERGRETALEHTNGLGLWLVRWIVTASGGEVTFEERQSRGSVVELVLPRIDPNEAGQVGETG